MLTPPVTPSTRPARHPGQARTAACGLAELYMWLLVGWQPGRSQPMSSHVYSSRRLQAAVRTCPGCPLLAARDNKPLQGRLLRLTAAMLHRRAPSCPHCRSHPARSQGQASRSAATSMALQGCRQRCAPAREAHCLLQQALPRTTARCSRLPFCCINAGRQAAGRAARPAEAGL